MLCLVEKVTAVPVVAGFLAALVDVQTVVALVVVVLLAYIVSPEAE